MTTARTAVRGTCRHTKAKTREKGATMTKIATPDTAHRIRVLNDNFRSTFVGGRVVMTQGVDALPLDTKARVVLAVQSFDKFTADNDPHREHDFGGIEIQGETYFFKIDYYTLDMIGGSEDPTDPEKTTRVLTIMRADEY
jgi:hypothetical protein